METLTDIARKFSVENKLCRNSNVFSGSANVNDPMDELKLLNKGNGEIYDVSTKEDVANKQVISNGDVGKNIKNLIMTSTDNIESGDFKFADDENASHISNENEISSSCLRNESSSAIIPDLSVTDYNTSPTSDVCKKQSNENSCDNKSINIALGTNFNYLKPIPNIIIPGDFDFIDGKNASSLTINQKKDSIDSGSKRSNASESGIILGHISIDSAPYLEAISRNSSTGAISKCSKNIPSVVIPGDFEFIDDSNISLNSRERLLSRSSTEIKDSKKNSVTTETYEDSSLPSLSSKLLSPNDQENNITDSPKRIPSVVIPGDFDFIDEINASSLTLKDQFLLSDPSEQIVSKRYSPSKSTKSDSFLLPTPASSSPMIFKIPSIYLPSNVQYIDDVENPPYANHRKLCRGERTHSSLKIPRPHSAKRRLCRYHSDSETKTSGEVKTTKQRHHRSRSRKVKRSVSAIETNKDNYKTSIRRSHSDRYGMIVAGKHLRPPGSRYRPQSHCEGGSSRCSSTKTLSTNVSISEIVAVEMGLKDIPGLTAKEARRRRIVCTVVVVSVTIAVVCVLLVAVTLMLSPEVDAILRKGNEEIYRSMAAGASTSSPTTEGAAVAANNSTPPSGSPG